MLALHKQSRTETDGKTRDDFPRLPATVQVDAQEDRSAEPQDSAGPDLAQALALREQAMGILGHELRNPLSAIAILARGTMRREDLPDDVRERLVQVDRAAQRSLAMIDSLLDFSESRWRGTLPVREVPTQLAAISEGVVEELRAANPGRVIALDVRSRSHTTLDPLRIGQVLSNLVSNALVHGFPHTPVQVTIDVLEGEAVIVVENQGPAIAPERVASLFEPFVQGSGAQPRGRGMERARGLGLGLYIVHVIVAAHGGTIAVESSAEAGTTFLVRLPQR
jgi:signal transduction histidine kinase